MMAHGTQGTPARAAPLQGAASSMPTSPRWTRPWPCWMTSPSSVSQRRSTTPSCCSCVRACMGKRACACACVRSSVYVCALSHRHKRIVCWWPSKKSPRRACTTMATTTTTMTTTTTTTTIIVNNNNNNNIIIMQALELGWDPAWLAYVSVSLTIGTRSSAVVP